MVLNTVRPYLKDYNVHLMIAKREKRKKTQSWLIRTQCSFQCEQQPSSKESFHPIISFSMQRAELFRELNLLRH